MKKVSFGALFVTIFVILTSVSHGKDLPKIAVWDLMPREVKPAYAQELTSILVSEISKLERYEVYSQESVRTLAGWSEERMKLGCTSTQCLTALGQMDIAKLISGSVGKIGNRYSVSMNLFDTQNARAEKAISEFCSSEDELIELVQMATRKLLGVEVAPSRVEPKAPEKETKTTSLAVSGKSFKDPYTGMEFVFIKGGCFEMGDTFGDGDKSVEKPVHEVCVDDFYMGVYEVTQGQWGRLMQDNPSSFKGGENYPVEKISWAEAQLFIERMNKQTGHNYRLPTEGEWEYAARSGGKKERFSGTSRKEELNQYAWYEKTSKGKTQPVGQKNPNGLGLYDMSGNVWEWCSDWFDGLYYKTSPKDNPKGPTKGTERVRRGGSWSESLSDVRAAMRNSLSPTRVWNDLGFRVCFSAR